MARIDTLLENQRAFTGIDFIRVVDGCSQRRLRIYFLTDLRELTPAFSTPGIPLTPGSIVISGDRDTTLRRPRVTRIVTATNSQNQAQYDETERRHFIEIEVDEPGGFAFYRLHIEDPRIETQSGITRINPAFNDVRFSFKIGCEDGLDCAPQAPDCPPEPEVDYPVDYLARDFTSFRNALLDFASQRYPNWSLPLEADVGTMLAEVFAALGDEFSYLQERYAREAFLETANQRRSLRKKARLLDFDIHDGQSPTTLLDVEVSGRGTLVIDYAARFRGSDLELEHQVTDADFPAELVVPSDDGTKVVFEFGHGLFDERNYVLDELWNRGAVHPYYYEREDPPCLPAGTTSILVEELTDYAVLVNPESPRYALLHTQPTQGERPRVHFARILQITNETDPLMPAPDGNGPLRLSRIHFYADDALPFDLNQETLQISLNVVFATAGKTKLCRFTTDAASNLDLEPTLYRESGSRGDNLKPLDYQLFGIPETDQLGLGFLGSSLRASYPEIRLIHHDTGSEWSYRRTLIGADSQDQVFTLEDGTYRAIRRFWTPNGMVVHRDYASARGYSLRFGEGEFGAKASETYTLRYRTGPGSKANVPAGSMQLATATYPLTNGASILSVTNPVAVTSGVDPESAQEIKLQVPEAYRAELFFAVKPEDYGTQAEKLPFVQRAQGAQRYTGSWLTNFVTADPFDSATLTEAETTALESWMDCVRQAGRDVIVKNPKILPLDLEITLCIEPHAYAADVAAQAHEVLLGPGSGRRIKGFFHPDHFTFGTPLYRSALEAALQRIPGVKSVRGMVVRERGRREYRPFSELVLEPAMDQVLRLDNDPNRPENGTLRIVTEGGA
ncbi:MAG: baseplate J/gp47 family protein [Polyangiaceae bacterium]